MFNNLYWLLSFLWSTVIHRFSSPCPNCCLAAPTPPVQSRRLLAELLLQTSQLRPKDQVVLVAATNRLGELFGEHDAGNTNCCHAEFAGFTSDLTDTKYLIGHGLLPEGRFLCCFFCASLKQSSKPTNHDRATLVFSCADDIDVALLRRFHGRIFVGPPSHKERVDMIASFMQGIEHALDSDHLSSLADRLPGWSGSDIQVCLPEPDAWVQFRSTACMCAWWFFLCPIHFRQRIPPHGQVYHMYLAGAPPSNFDFSVSAILAKV